MNETMSAFPHPAGPWRILARQFFARVDYE
jgi:hypothetical protein